MPTPPSPFPSPSDLLVELRRWLVVRLPPDGADDLDGVDNLDDVGGVAPDPDDDMLADVDVTLPITDLTNRQLLLFNTRLLLQQQGTLDRLDAYMGTLAESIEELQAAVDDVAVRFATQIVPLQEALAEAQAQIEQMELEDVEQSEALSTALAQAAEAAEVIAAEVQELNLLGAEPDVPVEPVDPEEIPDPPSSGEHPDNTLPGDLPHPDQGLPDVGEPDTGATGPTGPDTGATGPTGPDTGATGPTGPDTGATGPSGTEPYPDQTLPGDLPPDQEQPPTAP